MQGGVMTAERKLKGLVKVKGAVVILVTFFLFCLSFFSFCGVVGVVWEVWLGF
jgi:hypothetical protein